MKNQELLLIGGYMHSGTTLLHDILRSHDQILQTRKETKILEWSSEWQSKYIHQDKKLEYLKKYILNEKNLNEDFTPIHNDVVKDFFEFLSYRAKKENCKYYLEGSPNNYLVLDKLPSDLNYKLILITRDPRDIIASVKKRIISKNFGNASPLKGRLSNHYSFVLYLFSVRKSLKKMSGLMNRKNVFSTDYFVLTNDYRETIQDISKFLGLNAETFIDSKDVQTQNTADINYKPEKALYFSSNFRKILNHREISVIEYLFSEFFSERPYLKLTKKKFAKFWYFLYCLKIPYDLIMFLIARLIRFGSLKRFISYFNTTLRRFKS